MATLDYSAVILDIRCVQDASNVLKALVRDMFERLRADPASYPELDEVDARVCGSFQFLTLRKVDLIHNPHDYRVVFAHWNDGQFVNHVDLLLVFPRKAGFNIDWDWVMDQLQPPF